MKSLHVAFKNDHFDRSFMDILFHPFDEWEDDIRIVEPGKLDIFDCLVMLEIFPSKGQARKNWKGPTEFRPGFQHFERLGKMKKELVVWIPVKESEVNSNA